MLVRWEPFEAVAAGVGAEEARRFLEAEDFDFLAFNHLQDAGRDWADAEAEAVRTHPQWADHVLSYRRHFAASLTGEVPGTRALVEELRAAGVPQCGLTNWSEELYHAHAPARFDVLRLLDHVVVSGTEKVAKPDPRIYRIAAERTGIPLERLAFVDDSPPNVEAAAALGMRGVLFTGAEALRAELRTLGLPV